MIGRRHVILGLPLAVAAGGGGISYAMLQRMKRGTYDPHAVPDPLVGKPVPQFALPPLGTGPGLASAELRNPGRPVLVNFFASWCIPCVEEAPELMALHDRRVPIYGIAYKDQPDAALGFLRRHGDPYLRIATDLPGRTAIDFGLYGVPETYFIDRAGIIRWRWAGALSPDVAHDQLAALLRTYA